MALKVSIFADQNVTGVLKKISGKVLSVGKDFLKFGVVGSLAIAGISTKLAGDFDKGLREVSTLMKDVTEKDIKNMGRELESLSGKSGLAINSLVKARYDIVSAGFTKGADGAIVLAEATKLAVGGVTTAAAAADLLTTALNAYDKTATDAADISDILFTTVRLGKTTMTELSASMGNMLPIAKAANVRLEDSAAALALVTANGIDTATASTSLKNAFKNLAAPTDDAKVAMDKAGISVKTFGDGTIDLVSTMKQFKGLPLSALKEFIPDIRAINAIQIMADKVDGLASNIVEFEGRTGAATEAFDKMQLAFNTKMSRLKNNFARILREIGRQVISFLNKPIDEANKILETLGDIGWDKVVARIGTQWTTLVPIFQNILKEILKPVPALFSAVMQVAAKGAAIAFRLGWAAVGSIKDLLFPEDEAQNLALLFGAVGADAAKMFLETGNFSALGEDVANVFANGTREEILAQAEKLGIKEAVDIALGSVGFLGKEEGAMLAANLKLGIDSEDLVTAFGADFKENVAKLDLSGVNLDFSKIFGDPAATLESLIAMVNEAVAIITAGQETIVANTVAANTEKVASEQEANNNIIALLAALLGIRIGQAVELKEVEQGSFSERLGAFNDFMAVKMEGFKILNANELKGIQVLSDGLGKIADNRLALDKVRIKNKLDRDIKAAIASGDSEEAVASRIKILKEQAVIDERAAARKTKPIRLAQAVASGALAIINALASQPFIPVGLAAGAMATVATGLQIATINAQTFARGGRVQGYARGGLIPNQDTVPIMATPGERMSTVSASNLFGSEIDRFNQIAEGKPGGSGGGGNTYNAYITATDGASVLRMFEDNPEAAAMGIKGLFKTGHLSITQGA